MHPIEKRLEEMELVLPQSVAPVANYLPFVLSGSLLFISGQVPVKDGKLPFQGAVGKDISIEEGQEAAKLCALNLLTQVREACGGDFSKIARCVKLGGFVNAAHDFTQHPAVINGASDLIVGVMGEKGKHARFAVGVAGLPANVPVEIDAIFEMKSR